MCSSKMADFRIFDRFFSPGSWPLRWPAKAAISTSLTSTGYHILAFIWNTCWCELKTKCEYLHLFLLAGACRNSQPQEWDDNYFDNYGDICENFVKPRNLCDKKWGPAGGKYCDHKKCGEFCKKTCNKC